MAEEAQVLNPAAPVFIPKQNCSYYLPYLRSSFTFHHTNFPHSISHQAFYTTNTYYLGGQPSFLAAPQQTHLAEPPAPPQTHAGFEPKAAKRVVGRKVNPRSSYRRSFCGSKGRSENSMIQTWRAKSGHEQKKYDCLDMATGGNDTTVMIKNIPNKYTRDMLVEFLDYHCMMENLKVSSAVSAFDFVYLPVDFGTDSNKGYAFVNFTDEKAVSKFYDATHNQKWELLQSKKIRQIARARVQGKEELVRRFQSTQFPCDFEEYLPVCFSPPRDGSGKRMGDQQLVGTCGSPGHRVRTRPRRRGYGFVGQTRT